MKTKPDKTLVTEWSHPDWEQKLILVGDRVLTRPVAFDHLAASSDHSRLVSEHRMMTQHEVDTLTEFSG